MKGLCRADCLAVLLLKGRFQMRQPVFLKLRSLCIPAGSELHCCLRRLASAMLTKPCVGWAGAAGEVQDLLKQAKEDMAKMDGKAAA